MILTSLSLFDKLCGWREAKYRQKTGLPSDAAQSAWLDYYENLYQVYLPDPIRFAKLLQRHGPPDVSNPYSQGTEEFYRFYAGPLALVDVRNMFQVPLAAGNDDRDEDAVLAEVDLHEHLLIVHRHGVARLAAETNIRNLSLQCWGIWLAFGPRPTMGLSKKELRWLTLEALSKVTDWPKITGFDLRKVVKNALGWGWFTSSERQFLWSRIDLAKRASHINSVKSMGDNKTLKQTSNARPESVVASPESGAVDTSRVKLHWNRLPG